MRKICLFLLLLLVSVHGNAQISKTRKLPQPILVDGSDTDWEKPLPFYDSPSMLMYALGNDDQNLYICIKTIDRDNQVKIMRGGLKISFYLSKKRYTAISFPLPLINDPMPADDDKIALLDYNRLRKTFAENHPLMRLELTSARGPIKMNDNNTGIVPVISWDEEHAMIYEVAIPLTEIFGKSANSVSLKKPFTLKIEVPGVADYQGENRGGGKTKMTPTFGIGTSVGGGGSFGTGVGATFGGNLYGNNGFQGGQMTKRQWMFTPSGVEQKLVLSW